jgi:hypothetical protein
MTLHLSLAAPSQGPAEGSNPFFIKMHKESESYPRFQHPRSEFIYMLSGRMEYRFPGMTHRQPPKFLGKLHRRLNSKRMVRRHRSVAIALKKNEASEIVGLALEQVVNQRRTLTAQMRDQSSN